jgi:Holliday junction resolvase
LLLEFLDASHDVRFPPAKNRKNFTMNACRKGKRGELEFAAVLRQAGFPARRGRQFSGSPDSPDVICGPLAWLHVEVKRTEQLRLREAVGQAGSDCGGKPWLVAHRWNGGRWLAIVDMELFLRLVRGGLSKEAAT